MTDTVNLRLPCIEGSQAQKHITHNDALRILDALVQLAVLDRDLSAPPGAVAEGQRWIVAAVATDAWAGHDNAVAAWQDGAWQFSTPQTGWVAYVADEGALVVWSGSAWVGATAAPTTLNNMVLLGVGTTADAANPFSAKLNNALWTAKTAAEGGDGDLRYKLSKEAVANTLSLLFQNNFSGRAEIGLTGDDNFHFKVSTDGSAWTEAVVIDGATGKIGFGNPEPAGLNVSGGGAPTVQVAGSSGAGSLGVIRYTSPGLGGAPVTLLSTRGASALDYAAAVNGDGMGQFLFGASDGTRYILGAGLFAGVEGAVSTDNVPGYIAFATSPGGANNRPERMRITSDGTLRPGADNAYSLGSASFRWSVVHAASGTINTSDGREKTGIANSDLGLDFIRSLRPVSYRWAIGGVSVDTDGDEIARPGRRTHYGLIAQEVKAALGTVGVADFGGWTLSDPDDPQSTQGLRYDQFIAPLIKAVQEQQAMIEKLREHVAQLKWQT